MPPSKPPRNATLKVSPVPELSAVFLACLGLSVALVGTLVSQRHHWSLSWVPPFGRPRVIPRGPAVGTGQQSHGGGEQVRPTLSQALQVQLSCGRLCAGGGGDWVRGGFRPWLCRRVIISFASALCPAAASASVPTLLHPSLLEGLVKVIGGVLVSRI